MKSRHLQDVAWLTVLVKDLSTSLEPDGLLERDTVLGKELGGEASQGTEHSPPGVNNLNLPAQRP